MAGADKWRVRHNGKDRQCQYYILLADKWYCDVCALAHIAH